MTKAGDIGKDSAKGSFHLLWGLILSTVISAVGTIFIARLLGSEQYGLYAVVLTLPNLVAAFRDWSINSAIVKFTAQFRNENRLNEIRSIYLTGLIFEIVLGLALTIFSLLFADFLATNLFRRPTIAPLIEIASFTVLANGLIAAATAFFTGTEKMHLNSIMLTCQSILKTALIIGLVLLGFGTSGAVVGFTSGTIIAASIGIALTWAIYRGLPKPLSHKLEIKAYLTTMLRYCLPISLAVLIGGILPQYYAFLMPIHYPTDNMVIGNYGVALNFVVLISFFSMPILTVMFPAFSKIDPKKENEALRNVFRCSVKYASLLVIPVAALVMCLAQPAIETLFGQTYNTAPLFLALLAIQYFYTTIGSLSIDGLLNGQGESKLFLRMGVLTGIIGFPLGYLLIMNFGVLGLIVATLTVDLPSTIMGLKFIKKKYGATVDWLSSAKILASSAIPAIITYLVVIVLPFSSWIRLIIGVIVFVTLVIPCNLLSKTIDNYDLSNFKEMTSNLGFVGRILKRVLGFIEKMMVFLKR